jgi:hypothetical protein
MNRLFEREGERTIFATRAIIAIHALWIVGSRPCLPSLLRWPAEFWLYAPAGAAARFGWWLGSAEWVLWVAMIAAIAISPFHRIASFAASLLLYHFAPLEDVIIGSPGPYVRGLTVDVLAFAILAFGADGLRWSITLVRFIVASQYTFATVAKLRVAGLHWFSGENMQDMARTFRFTGIAPHPEVVIGHPAVAAVIGWGWLALSTAVIAAPFSRRIARVVVPLLAVAHVVAAAIFGIVWLAAPLLLVFANWDHVARSNSSIQRLSA